MKDMQNVTITLLLISAMVLGGLLIASWNEEKAYAAASSDRNGDYIMTAGAWSGNHDLLYVIDVPSKRLNVYYPDPGTANKTGSIESVDTADLERTFRAK
jgi:hypothetical protein